MNYPALYQGDLRLKLSDGVLWPILTLHVEDYLLGDVVPYEMSNSLSRWRHWKAQTVAARTYALRKHGSGGDYDVVDVPPTIRSSRGTCPATATRRRPWRRPTAFAAFSAAGWPIATPLSNGGQTELPETVWRGSGALGYYAVADDLCDVENPRQRGQEL